MEEEREREKREGETRDELNELGRSARERKTKALPSLSPTFSLLLTNKKTSALTERQNATHTQKNKTKQNPPQRWVRVSKDKNEESGNKYTSENWEEGGATRVQPKSGSEYTVWPVVHALLTERGLDDVDAEEALRLQRAGKAVIVDCRPTYQVCDFFSFFSHLFFFS